MPPKVAKRLSTTRSASRPSKLQKINEELEEERSLLKKSVEKNAEATTSGIRDIFTDYQHEAKLSALLDNVEGIRKKKNGELVLKDRLARIKRIESAIKENVREISTFEFLCFSSPLHADTEDVAAEIFLIAFSDKGIERIPLYEGSLPRKTEIDQRVIYLPISKRIRRSTTVYLVTRVELTSVVSSGRRRQSVGDEVRVKEVLWGTKNVMGRSGDDDNGDISVHYGNSSVPLVNPNAMTGKQNTEFRFTPTWYEHEAHLAALESLTKGLLISSTIPRVDYEMSDQHCEEDWPRIGEYVKRCREMTAIGDGKEALNFIFEEKAATPDKENASPAKKNTQTVLARVPVGRCPFSFREYDSAEVLVRSLNFIFTRLHFDLKNDDTVLVRLPAAAEHVHIERAASGATRKAWDRAALPFDVLPFNPPREDTVTLGVTHKDVHRHYPHGDWIEKMANTKIELSIHYAQDTKEFMQMVNSALFKNEFDKISKKEIRDTFMNFLEEKKHELLEKGMEFHMLGTAASLKDYALISAEDYAHIYDTIGGLLILEQDS